MTIPEAIEILKIHNKWRRGVDLGKAIDIVVGVFFKKLKDRKL